MLRRSIPRPSLLPYCALAAALFGWLAGAAAAQVPPADTVLQWNTRLLDAFRAGRIQPPAAAREMAILNVAMFEAVNAATGMRYTAYHYDGPPQPNRDPVLAAAAAAQTVLAALHPPRARRPTASRDPSTRLGTEMANEILALRGHDGADQHLPPYLGRDAPGLWRPTPPALRPGVLPHWAAVMPWAIGSMLPFRPPGPPALNSARWMESLDKTAELGAAGSKLRTAEQTESALFWADGDGTGTPPGHWLAIAGNLARAQRLDLADTTRLLALLSIAEADAAIVAWDAKYHYSAWRPITAIRAVRAHDPDARIWTPLLPTPAFPEYVSGHSILSAAGAEMLCLFFGTDRLPFSTSTDGKDLPGVTHRYARFSLAADEAGMSRIWAGLHFLFSHQDGQTAGRSVADTVFAEVLRPAGETAQEPQVCAR